MATQETLDPWLQLTEVTGQPAQVVTLLREQLRAHKAKLAAQRDAQRQRPEPEPEPEPEPTATAEQPEEDVGQETDDLKWVGSPPSRLFKGWTAGAGTAESDVPLGDKELDDLLARAANLRGRDVSRTLTALDVARKQLAAKDPRTAPTARRQLGRVWAALARVTADVPVLRVRMLVGFAEWCEGEEPVGMSDLQTMAAWAAAGKAADEDGEFVASTRIWDKLLLALSEPNSDHPLPVIGVQLAMSQALVGRSAAHLRDGKHAEAVSLLRRNVHDWRQRLETWEATANGSAGMNGDEISEGSVAREELATALLCLADVLDDPDVATSSTLSDTNECTSVVEAATLRVAAKSCHLNSAHRVFGRVRSSFGAQYWDTDGDDWVDSRPSDSQSQWDFEGSRSLPFPQSLTQNFATTSTRGKEHSFKSLGHDQHARRTGLLDKDIDMSRTYARAGSGLDPSGSGSLSGISAIDVSGVAALSTSHRSAGSASPSPSDSNNAAGKSKSSTRARVAADLRKLHQQPGFESPMPLWFRGLTANHSDTRGPLDIAYRKIVGPLDGDGRIVGVPGLVPAIGTKGALQKRRLILAKMEMRPEIVGTIMGIAGYDPTSLDTDSD